MCKNSVIQSIYKNWDVDADLENLPNMPQYFYSYAEVDNVLSGHYCFVIGRKGSGKSALRNHVVRMEKEQNNTFAESLSFKNFPFEDIYALRNKNSYAQKLKHTIIWEYIIFLKVCKMFTRNESFRPELLEGLRPLFPEYKPSEIYKEIKSWNSANFAIKISNLFQFGIGGSKQSKPNQRAMEEKLEIIEEIVLKNCDKSTYFIVFDELDEDYDTISDLEERSRYKNILVGLLKAVQYIKMKSREYDINIRPILFLRDDIYDRLSLNDKNKRRDNVLYLRWDTENLKNLIAHRIIQDNEQSGTIFEVAIKSIFNDDLDPDTLLKRILDLGHLRPRDVVTYIKTCCKYAIRKGMDLIDLSVMELAEIEYSERFRDEIQDEIYPIIPEYGQLWNLLKYLGREFTPKKFIEEHNYFRTWGQLNQIDSQPLLQELFKYNIIGNVYGEGAGKKFSFKYKQPNLQINYGANLFVHPGLHKILFDFG